MFCITSARVDESVGALPAASQRRGRGRAGRGGTRARRDGESGASAREGAREGVRGREGAGAQPTETYSRDLCAQWLVRCGALSACGGWTPVLSAPARACTTRSGARTRRRDATGSAPTDSYSCARDAEHCGSFCAHPKLKTSRFALGPKNVHQPWPLALNHTVNSFSRRFDKDPTEPTYTGPAVYSHSTAGAGV